jgi:hypothetical protein
MNLQNANLPAMFDGDAPSHAEFSSSLACNDNKQEKRN